MKAWTALEIHRDSRNEVAWAARLVSRLVKTSDSIQTAHDVSEFIDILSGNMFPDDPDKADQFCDSVREHRDTPDLEFPFECDSCSWGYDNKEDSSACCEDTCGCSDPGCPCSGIKRGPL